ncbi:MAG: hypothetical protein ISR99_01135 [Parcubacteria group bacterium]|nr:hypothetical protein [Parcubacteria group bacterium]
MYTKLTKPQKIKIVIENNPNKAKKLRKQLSKNFYIPSELREEYELF